MLPLKHFEITAVRKKVFGTSFIVDVMRVDRDVFHFPWKVPIATLNVQVRYRSYFHKYLSLAQPDGSIHRCPRRYDSGYREHGVFEKRRV